MLGSDGTKNSIWVFKTATDVVFKEVYQERKLKK